MYFRINERHAISLDGKQVVDLESNKIIASISKDGYIIYEDKMVLIHPSVRVEKFSFEKGTVMVNLKKNK